MSSGVNRVQQLLIKRDLGHKSTVEFGRTTECFGTEKWLSDLVEKNLGSGVFDC